MRGRSGFDPSSATTAGEFLRLVPRGPPAAIFPLPGGRDVAAPVWVPGSRADLRERGGVPLPESTAERRRWYARRRACQNLGASAVEGFLDPAAESEP